MAPPGCSAPGSSFTLAPLFRHIQIEGEHDFGKPDPRAYRHALESLQVTPPGWSARTSNGKSLLRLGIRSIWHDHLGRGLPAGTAIRPHLIMRHLPELLA
jgi:putative hydrolase of the HAD superfamily